MSVYGSRPDLLPDAIRRQRKGVAEIGLLSLKENQAVEAVSLNKFRHLPGDVLDWRDVNVRDRIVYDDEPGAVEALDRLLAERSGRGSETIVLWGSLVLPSVRMPVGVARKHLAGIVEVGPQFWIFLPSENYLIECLPEGRITGAYVPTSGTCPEPEATASVDPR